MKTMYQVLLHEELKSAIANIRANDGSIIQRSDKGRIIGYLQNDRNNRLIFNYQDNIINYSSSNQHGLPDNMDLTCYLVSNTLRIARERQFAQTAIKNELWIGYRGINYCQYSTNELDEYVEVYSHMINIDNKHYISLSISPIGSEYCLLATYKQIDGKPTIKKINMPIWNLAIDGEILNITIDFDSTTGEIESIGIYRKGIKVESISEAYFKALYPEQFYLYLQHINRIRLFQHDLTAIEIIENANSVLEQTPVPIHQEIWDELLHSTISKENLPNNQYRMEQQK